MSDLTIVDLHQEDELSACSMDAVSGGLDWDYLQTASKQLEFMMSACDSVIRGLAG